MEILRVSDEEIDHNTSKWLLEYAHIVGCDRFSVDIEDKEPEFAIEYQRKLLAKLEQYYLGEAVAEIFVMYNGEPNIRRQKFWTFNRDSLHVISENMGDHLLDDLLACNEGVSGWRFYKKDKIVACAVYGFDYFYFSNPPKELVEKLGPKATLEHT
ncbi:hypothetical protein CGH22_21715 [Vibrio parahaemolyticus]|uniref:hypothetical protein n=1 Tax=Vibrio parahaemolyticus TaxID=670 RepID=UPI00112348CB|nr:hypothetical protein [Vibrio parahaemolyticus]EJG1033462.1 hypothetical protein [Vibrio parahaemolyticus]TOP15060.1 hypothetical protein CGH22_21715 [Vibrio parahaemolyticus]TOQ47978.1 hypothetical protein CGG94_24635 [Vibrio parahaemolyticus]HCG7544660.1 hypothetical protein [Vibrio parahaemolyticus]HCH0358883.1 hypothetical protein [Vibrio parahaemolyticus]